ncbi:MAG: hypothetical protein QOK25_981 [Thermoleophilaceae bacterium]|nr:hypothetical protein [Thermoleophilaceae bacterium]
MTEARKPTRDIAHLAALAAIVVVGAIVRVLLVNEPMRYDESYTFVTYATHPASFITTTYDFPNNHILHTLAVHYAWRVLGNHVWVVRLPALLAGIALIPATYLAGRALYGRAAALWAAALAAGFATLIDFSVDARGYTMGITLALLALWLAAGLLDGGRPWRWPAFAVCCALAVYTVPTIAYAIATVAAWTAAVALVRRDLTTLVRLAVALALAAGLDVALYSGVLGQAGWTASRPLHDSVGAATGLARVVWTDWNRTAPWPVEWLVIGGFVASLVFHRRLARHPVPLVVPAAAVILAVLVFTPAARLPRAWLWLLPLYLMHAGAGLAFAVERATIRLPRAAPASGLLAAAGVAIVLAANMMDTRQHGSTLPPVSDNQLVAFLKRDVGPGQVVLLNGHVGVACWYYFQRYRYTPPGLPPRHARVTALLVVPRALGRRGVGLTVGAAGWRVRPGAPPVRLVKRFDYVDAWRARIE